MNHLPLIFQRAKLKLNFDAGYCDFCVVQDIDKKDVSLSKFKGKVLLIVNVASRWYDLFTLYLCESLIFFSCNVMFRGNCTHFPFRLWLDRWIRKERSRIEYYGMEWSGAMEWTKLFCSVPSTYKKYTTIHYLQIQTRESDYIPLHFISFHHIPPIQT